MAKRTIFNALADGRRAFTFHGTFDSKEKAKKREREVKGFILKRNGRYYVVTRNKK